MPPSPFTPLSISTGTIIRAVLVVASFIILYSLRDVVLVVLTAVVIASAIEPLTLRLIRYGVSRLISVLIIYIVLSFAFVGVFYFFVPSLLSDTANFLRTVPDVLHGIPASFSLESETIAQGTDLAQTLSQSIGEGREALRAPPSSLNAVFTDLSQILGSFAQGFWDNISVVFGGIISFVLIVVLSFYLAVQDDGVGKFLRVITPISHEEYVVGLWKRSQKKIGLWMQGQIFLAVFVGMLVYAFLAIFGQKFGITNPLLFAVMAAIFETIPLFGPILAAIPAVLTSYSTVGLSSALFIAGIYTIIQQFENHLLYPVVVKKIIGVPPILVVLALIVGVKLAGFLGVILSVPLAATLMEYLDDVQKRKTAPQT